MAEAHNNAAVCLAYTNMYDESFSKQELIVKVDDTTVMNEAGALLTAASNVIDDPI